MTEPSELDTFVAECIRDGAHSVSDLPDHDYRRVLALALDADGPGEALAQVAASAPDAEMDALARHVDMAHAIGVRDQRLQLIGEIVWWLLTNHAREIADRRFERLVRETKESQT